MRGVFEIAGIEKMKNAIRIARHEMRQILREPKFLIPFLLPPLFLLGSHLFLFSEQMHSDVLPYTMLLCALLISPMVVPLASDSFAGERERNSLELLQLLPIHPLSIFWGKVLALIPIPLFFLVFSEFVFAKMLAESSFVYLWKTLWMGFCSTNLFTVIALLVSLYAKSARAANQISLLFFFMAFFFFQMGSSFYLSNAFAPLWLGLLTLLADILITFFAVRRFRKL